MAGRPRTPRARLCLGQMRRARQGGSAADAIESRIPDSRAIVPPVPDRADLRARFWWSLVDALADDIARSSPEAAAGYAEFLREVVEVAALLGKHERRRAS
jgi:hypothetical protein